MDKDKEKEYFQFFDQAIEKQTSLKIRDYYEEIKKEFSNVIQYISSANAWASIKELIILDAKLQILSSLIEDNIFELPEQEIIRLSEIDSTSYYQEILKMDGSLIHHSQRKSLLLL